MIKIGRGRNGGEAVSVARPDAPRIDLELIRKYATAGPRYTSYPPATHFTGEVDRRALEMAIKSDNEDPKRPLSLYFHLPFCESLCWYCGCNTIITRRREAASEYLETLAQEIALIAALMKHGRPVKQIHFGGGTPTFLTPAGLRRIGQLIRDNFDIDPACEFGVEVDPRRLDEERVEALRDIGANRASIGVQDTNPAVQLAIHRWQPSEMNHRAVSWLRNANFRSINIDLIYGLPRQTPESFEQTITDVLALEPQRLSVFSYAHVPWIRPAQRIFEERGELPSSETKLTLFSVAHRRLTVAGFIDIGLDHFARPDDELAVAQRQGTLQRNFQGYSTAAGASLYGFGISSISAVGDSYRQNHKTLEGWRSALAEGNLPVERGLMLTEEDRRRRAIIMSVMCDRRLNYAKLSERLGVDVARAYASELAGLDDLEADGLLQRTEHDVKILPKGIPLLRVVAMRFDATLTGIRQRHSQTV